jgi:hypothetical protein
MERMNRRRALLHEDVDPMGGVANLFDAAMVFAVALLVALVAAYTVPELLDPDASMTLVKNPGQPNMQVIVKDKESVKVMDMTEDSAGGEGIKMGTLYRLESGKVVYVLDAGS